MQTHEELARTRISKWMIQAQDIRENKTWTEKREAFDFGEHTFVLGNGQVFQCSHCGAFDPEWTAQEVRKYFKDMFNVKFYEIEVTVSWEGKKA